MASITPGLTTFRDVFSLAKFNVETETAADYNNGNPDFRRVQVAGLPYSGNPDEAFIIPATADEVTITLDGEEVAKFDIEHNEATKAERDSTLHAIGQLDSSSDDEK